MPKRIKDLAFRKDSASVIFYVALLYVAFVFLFFGVFTYSLMDYFDLSSQNYQEASTQRAIQLKKDELKISIDTKAALLNSIYLDKIRTAKEKIKNRVLNMDNMVTGHYKTDPSLQKNKTKLLDHLIDISSTFSWEDHNYIFLIDTNGKLHAHPDKDLVGKTREHFSKDSPQNKFVESLFKLSAKNDEGFFTDKYFRPHSDKLETKIYFAKLFKPLNTYIITGEYEEKIKQKAYRELINIIMNEPSDPHGSMTSLIGSRDTDLKTIVTKNSTDKHFDTQKAKKTAMDNIRSHMESNTTTAFLGSVQDGFIGYFSVIPQSPLILYKIIPTDKLKAEINNQNKAINKDTKDQLIDIITFFGLFVLVITIITLTLGKFIQKIFEASAKKIIENNRFLNTFMNSIDDPIIVLDKHDKIVDINEAVTKYCEKHKGMILEKHIDDFENIKLLTKNDGEKIKFLELDGKNHYFFCKTTLLAKNEQKDLKLIFCKNITDIKNLQESVMEFFSNSASPIVTIKKDGQMLFHNKAFLDIFELTSDIKERTNISTVIRREFKKLFDSKLNKAFESGFAEEFSIILISKSSGSLHAKISITKFSNEDYYIINIRDTTAEVMHTLNLERIVQEEIEKREENELKFATIFQNAPAGIVVIDENNHIIQINKTFETMSGYEKDALIEKDFVTLFDEESQQQIGAHIKAFMYQKEDSSTSNEWCMRTKKRTKIYLNTFIKSIKLKNGFYKLIIVSDVTELKEIKEKEKKQELMLVQQSRFAVMGEMLNMIAHQWRQPLGALSIEIMNLMDNYEDGLKDSYMRDWEKRSSKIIAHLSKTIDEFRTFFKQDTKKDYFNVEDACLNSYNLIQPILKFRSIDVKLDLKAKGTILGYHNRLQQAILNILNNAKDALIDTDPKVKKIRFSSEIKDNTVIIEIEDNAGGITIEPIEKIFEPYYSTKKKNSSGIGLYMTKTIIENQMGGTIEANNSDKGAHFRIQFPTGL